MAYLFRHSLWFSSMALCFVIGIHYSIIQANRLAQPTAFDSASADLGRVLSGGHGSLGRKHRSVISDRASREGEALIAAGGFPTPRISTCMPLPKTAIRPAWSPAKPWWR